MEDTVVPEQVWMKSEVISDDESTNRESTKDPLIPEIVWLKKEDLSEAEDTCEESYDDPLDLEKSPIKAEGKFNLGGTNTTVTRIKLEHFARIEDVLKRQEKELEDDESFFDCEVCSEDEDQILENDDDQNDVFTDHEGFNDETETSQDTNERQFEFGTDCETAWTNKSFPSVSSCSQKKIITSHIFGPKGAAKEVTTAYDLFSLFISDSVVDMIVKHTNEEMQNKRQQSNSKGYTSSKWYTNPTDACEIKALMGILYRAGVLKMNLVNTEDLFSFIDGPSFFRCVMSKNRFEFLIRTLRFDDKLTRNLRKAQDKFAAFREFWSLFVQNCKSYYSPSEYLTVDETFIGFRGRCPFKTYFPNKADKYGLKIVALCDAKTFYFIDGIPYLGKEPNDKKTHFSVPTQYVLKLTEIIQETNRNITMDNWFTSIELADELQKRGLTLVGALRKNKPEIPKSILDSKNIPVMDSKFLFQPEKMLVSFNPQRNKKIILLSSMHSLGKINSNSGKQEILKFYNITKSGVDALNYICHDKTTTRKTIRWTLRYFYAVLDIAAYNAYVLHKWNSGKGGFSTRERNNFIKSLSYSLAEPHLKRRIQNKFLTRELKWSIKTILGSNIECYKQQSQIQEPKAKKPRRCDVCLENKKKSDRKGYAFCIKCDNCLCGEHKKVICDTCSEDL